MADITTTIGNSEPAVTSMQAAFLECFAYAYLLFNVFSTHPWHTSLHNLQSWSNSKSLSLVGMHFVKPLKAVLLYSFHPLVSTVATAAA
jgi:hypothetical protein